LDLAARSERLAYDYPCNHSTRACSQAVLMAVPETCGAQMQDYQHLLSSFKKAQTLYHWFEKEFGSWFCHEIIGFHLDEQEKIREWEAAGGRERCCRLAGETAAQVIRILQED